MVKATGKSVYTKKSSRYLGLLANLPALVVWHCRTSRAFIGFSYVNLSSIRLTNLAIGVRIFGSLLPKNSQNISEGSGLSPFTPNRGPRRVFLSSFKKKFAYQEL